MLFIVRCLSGWFRFNVSVALCHVMRFDLKPAHFCIFGGIVRSTPRFQPKPEANILPAVHPRWTHNDGGVEYTTYSSVCKTASQIMSATIFSIQLFCNHLQRSCILYRRWNASSHGIVIESAIYCHTPILYMQCRLFEWMLKTFSLVLYAGTLNLFCYPRLILHDTLYRSLYFI